VAQQPNIHFENWFEMVSRTQQEQPSWMTPLVTSSPRLEQEFRFDASKQGTATDVYGTGRGLDIIPAERIQIVLGAPPYVVHHESQLRDGMGDVSLLVKYRMAARNERNGNYVVTAFLGVSLPTGNPPNGVSHGVITPSIALGKGWGLFDIQTTFGVALPTGGAETLGRPISSNTTLQYRVLGKLWPEVEINSTFWRDGAKAGRNQVYVTPGLIVGRIPLNRRVALVFGAGFQIAATRYHAYSHAAVFTFRVPFK
jgi:hypothetical protein